MTESGDRRLVPAYKKTSFACPHCGALAGQWWQRFMVYDEVNNESDEIDLTGAQCFACNEWSVWRIKRPGEDPWAPGQNPLVETAVRVWPTSRYPAAKPSADMPEAVLALYNEASGVAAASPRSAAALLRLALEGTLKSRYPNEGNLNAMISAASRDGLSPQVSQAMDVLRFNGNEAVHELHLEDTSETVTALFDLLNLVVNQLISQPRRIKEMFDAMPVSVRDSIERRDGKGIPPTT